MTNAIADLYVSYHAELCNYLKRRFGAGVAEAEDVVQQAFASLAAMREPAQVRNPRAYLYRASQNILIEERRRQSSWRRNVEPALAGDGAVADEVTPERVLLANERLEILNRVLGRLPLAQRRSFLSNRLDGLSCAEIARRDGYSESAVKKHIAQTQSEIDTAVTNEAGRSGWRFKTTVMSVVTLVCAAVTLLLLRAPVHTERLVTQVGEVRAVLLPDGSRLTLGGRTEIKVSFTRGSRQVELLDGEVFFKVAHDTRRPFFVSAGSSTVRVVGTQFDVRRGSAEVDIGVQQGVVEVATQPAGTTGVTRMRKVLTAGQGVSAGLRDGGLRDLDAGQVAATASWRTGRRVYVDTALREIVADMNRYSSVPVSIADPGIGELRLSTSFHATRPQQVLGSLEIALSVVVDRADPQHIVLRAAPTGGDGERRQ